MDRETFTESYVQLLGTQDVESSGRGQMYSSYLDPQFSHVSTGRDLKASTSPCYSEN